MGQLEGKVALITGATSGIGEGTARRFVSEGASVMIAGRREGKGRSLAAELGPRAAFIRADVAVEDEVKAAVNATVAQFGRLDVMFNNAGAGAGDRGLDTIDQALLTRAVNVLLGGVVWGSKYAARQMRVQGRGVILNNASISAIRTGYGSHMYSAMKAAVIHFTRTTASELAPAGIRVNAIAPGPIATPIFGRALGLDPDAADETVEVARQALSQLAPLGRTGESEDIASTAVWLASDGASFVTGQTIVVDGGVTLGRRFQDMAEGHKAMLKAFHQSKP